MSAPVDLPWVLIRKDRPPTRYATLDLAKRGFDSLRFNGAARSDGIVFGPHNEVWKCGPTRWATWFRNDRIPRPKELEEETGAEAGV